MIMYTTALVLAAAPWNVDASNASALIRHASSLVRKATVMAVFDTDDDGLPTDAVLKAAFSDAVCAQCAFWDAAQIDPATGGVGVEAPRVTSKSIGGASLGYAQESAAVQQGRSAAATVLCSEARLILSSAGVLSSKPRMT